MSASSKRQDRKAPSAENDIFEVAPLFAPLRHDLPRRVATATLAQEYKITTMSTEVTRLVTEEDFSVETLDAIIEQTQRIGDQMSDYVTQLRRASSRRGLSEQSVNELEDD